MNNVFYHHSSLTADPGQAPSLDVSKDEDYVISRYAWFHALE